MNVQPSCCLDVVVYMLNCVFWRHILLEIEFKSRVDMGSESQIAFGYCTAVSPMSGSPTFDTGKKNRNGANLKLRHTLRVGGVINMGDSIPCDVQAERVIKELLNKLNVSVELKNEQRIIPFDVNNVITAFFRLTLLQSYVIQ